MTDLIEVNVANLSGEALNWAVGKAEGLDVFLASPVYGNPWRVFVRYAGEVTIREVRYAPQANWADGGPLMEKHRMLFLRFGKDGYSAYLDGYRPAFYRNGETMLVSACRTIVAAKLGDTVQVPKELICVY